MADDQGFLFGTPPPAPAEKQGPEVFKVVKVHFERPEDLKAFGEKIGQAIPVDAKGITYPKPDLS